MKKIAVIALSYGWLPGEGGTTRFSFLAELLSQKGYDVTLISSSFYHVKKKKRDLEELRKGNYPYRLFFLEEPGYKKNISLKRLYSHHRASRNLKKHLRETKYDLIYCVIPPNNVAKVAALHARANRIPLVVDVEDLWPEGWRMIFGKNKLLNYLLRLIKRDADIVYRYADGVIGTSDEYTFRALSTNQKLKKNSETVYVCIDIHEFDEGVKRYSKELNKNEQEFWVTYAGTLGKSYDIPTLISAAQELWQEGYRDIKFLILGTGPYKEEWENRALEKPCNVKFFGFVPYPKMAAFLSSSDVLVNSIVKKSVASIITKIGDYLSAEKPMINTCASKEFCGMVSKEGFGINVEAENVKALKEAILLLYENPEKREKMGKKARKFAEEKFDRTTAYEKIVNLIEKTGERNENN